MRALITFCIPDLAPFMTLVVSDVKAKHLLKSKPLLLKESLRASNRFRAVPMLTIGISKNLTLESKT